MTETSIKFVPIGGLCNRMRAMASGVYVADALNCPITFFWNKNRECHAAFTDLFKPIPMDWIRVKPFAFSHGYLAWDRKKNLYLPGLVRRLMFDQQLIDSQRMEDDEIERLKGRVYMISAGIVAPFHPFEKLFVPTNEIQEQIDRLRSQFAPYVYGIHIRRTDNHWSIQKNGVDDYIRFMDQAMETNPHVRFYVATDSLEVKQSLIKRYGERIIQHSARLDRTSVQGMKDALIDLWCLSLTNEIIGSFHSSYSEIASELGKIKLRILE